MTEAGSPSGNQTLLDGKSSSRQLKVPVIGRDIHAYSACTILILV